MLEIYIDSVIRLVNVEDRPKVEEQLRSRIAKLLAGKTDDESVARVMEYLGEPKVLVSEYQADQYLIGPQLYVAYQKVLKIMFRVVLILFGASNLAAILIASMLSFNFSDVISRVLGVLPALISIILYTIAIITLFFAFVEKNMKDSTKTIIDYVAAFEIKQIGNEIKRIFQAKEGRRGRFFNVVALINIIIGVLALFLFVFIPDVVAMRSGEAFYPLLHKEVLFQYARAIWLVFGIYIAMNVCKLFFIRWNYPFAIINAMSALGFVVLLQWLAHDDALMNEQFLSRFEVKVIDQVYTLADIWTEIIYFVQTVFIFSAIVIVLYGFYNAFLVARERKGLAVREAEEPEGSEYQ